MKKVMESGGALFMVMLTAGLIFSSCTKSSSGNNNGKVDPSSIAKSDLIDYFSFDGNGTDSVTGMTPSKSNGVTYVTGKRGQAYQGGYGAYLLYKLPINSKISSLKAFSVAMWLYAPIVDSTGIPIILQLDGGNYPEGNLCLTQFRQQLTSDSLWLGFSFFKGGVPSAFQTVGILNIAFHPNQWFHLIYTYNNVTSTFETYVNGIQLNLPTDITHRVQDSTANPAPLGDLNFVNATSFSIGGWISMINNDPQVYILGWFKGWIDELRIYDRALTAAEAKSLFDAEVSEIP